MADTAKNVSMRVALEGIDAVGAGFQKIEEAGTAAFTKMGTTAKAVSNEIGTAIPAAFSKIQAAASGGDILKPLLASVAGGALITGFFDFIAKANRALVEMAQHAHQVSLTVQEFQGFQYAFQVGGADDKKWTEGADALAQKLNEMKNGGENDLSKWLDANNVKWKEANGQVISLSKTVAIVSDLIRNTGSYQDKIKYAGYAGLDREMIPTLEKGSRALKEISDEAPKVSQATVDAAKKLDDAARKFDEEWRVATIKVKAYVQNWVLESVGSIDRLIDKAKEFADKTQAAYDWIKQAAMGANTASGPAWIQGNPAWVDALAEAHRKTGELMGGTGAEARGLEQAAAAVAEAVAEYGKAQSVAFSGDVARRVRTDREEVERQAAATEKLVAETMKLATLQPNMSTTKDKTADAVDEKANADAFTRAQDAIRKRTAEYNAETAAVGLNAEAKITLKAIADQESAALRAHITLTDEQKRSVLDLAAAAGKAAQGAKDAEQKFAGMNSAISYGGTEVLSILDQIGKRGSSVASIMETVRTSLIKVFEQAAVMGTGPLAGVLGTQSAAGSGQVGGLIGALAKQMTGASAEGGGAGTFLPSSSFAEHGFGFRLGGIMSSRGRIPLRRYDAGGVASSPQYSIFGEGGKPEAYVPLNDGRSIPVTVSGGKSGGSGGGGSQIVNLHMHDYVGIDKSQQSVTQADGSMDMHVTLRNTVTDIVQDDVMNHRAISQTFAQRFGLDPTKGLS